MDFRIPESKWMQAAPFDGDGARIDAAHPPDRSLSIRIAIRDLIQTFLGLRLPGNRIASTRTDCHLTRLLRQAVHTRIDQTDRAQRERTNRDAAQVGQAAARAPVLIITTVAALRLAQTEVGAACAVAQGRKKPARSR
jgi:hypothetical protein